MDEAATSRALQGFGHYEVYAEPAFSQVMTETTAWFRKYLPDA
jgi:hypothetical protein